MTASLLDQENDKLTFEVVEDEVVPERRGGIMRKAITLVILTVLIGSGLSQAFAQSADQQKQKWSGKQRDCVERGNCPK
jgi:hypothetical protein